jgi:hypothetical protein
MYELFCSTSNFSNIFLSELGFVRTIPVNPNSIYVSVDFYHLSPTHPFTPHYTLLRYNIVDNL